MKQQPENGFKFFWQYEVYTFFPFTERPFSFKRVRSLSTVKLWKSLSWGRDLDPSTCSKAINIHNTNIHNNNTQADLHCRRYIILKFLLMNTSIGPRRKETLVNSTYQSNIFKQDISASKKLWQNVKSTKPALQINNTDLTLPRTTLSIRRGPLSCSPAI